MGLVILLVASLVWIALALSIELFKAFRERDRLKARLQARDELDKHTELPPTIAAPLAPLPPTTTYSSREDWFGDLPFIEYANEIEVEVKFITPLVFFLGYHPNDVRLRVPVDIRLGTQTATGVADWTLRRNTLTRGDDPSWIVIEAKAVDVPLTWDICGQARSYAIVLGASHYLAVNGRRVLLYRLGLPTDSKIVDTSVEGLPAIWDNLRDAISQNPEL